MWSWQWPVERIIEADPLKTTWEVVGELSINHSTVIWHLKQIGKVKKLSQWVPLELTANQKSCHFEVSSYSTQQQCTISWLDCGMRSHCDWEEAPKHLAKLAPENGHGHWCSAASLIHYSFLNPSRIFTSEKYAQQIDEIYWKLQCLELALVNRKGPVLCENTQLHIAQPVLQKLNELGYEVLPHPSYSSDLSPTDYHLKYLDNLLLLQLAGCFQEFVEFQSMHFYATGINKLSSYWQKCVEDHGSYFN